MTNKKPEELNNEELDQVNGGWSWGLTQGGKFTATDDLANIKDKGGKNSFTATDDLARVKDTEKGIVLSSESHEPSKS